jgi:omega-hydroxy-beta-dihydromenaquinone-9 sulfotransferase
MNRTDLLVRLVAMTQQIDKNWKSPSIWYGATLTGWWNLLRRNGFSISRENLPLATRITLMAGLNSSLHSLEKALLGRQVASIRLQDPVFIIGHWRTGTTLLHELLSRDPRHSIANTYECMIPGHFLLSEDFAIQNLQFLMPPTRPMDNMPAGLEHPWEDEFALLNLGMPSLYHLIAFPSRKANRKFVDLSALSTRQKRHWQETLTTFMKRVAYRRPGRIVLKTPAHTARIPLLLGAFPNARFIHMVRNPYDVFPSMVNLWRQVCTLFSLEPLDESGLEDLVLDIGELLYRRFEDHRDLIPAEHYAEIRFEDLVADQLGTLEQTYAKVGLGSFKPAKNPVRNYLEKTQDYRRNRFHLSPRQMEMILDRWGWIITRYGYDSEHWQPHERREFQRQRRER